MSSNSYRVHFCPNGRKRILNVAKNAFVCEVDSSGKIRGIEKDLYVEYIKATDANTTFPLKLCKGDLVKNALIQKAETVTGNWSMADFMQWSFVPTESSIRKVFPNRRKFENPTLGDDVTFDEAMDEDTIGSTEPIDNVILEDTDFTEINWASSIKEHKFMEYEGSAEQFLRPTPTVYTRDETHAIIQAKGFKSIMVDKLIIITAEKFATGVNLPWETNIIMADSLFGRNFIPLTLRNMYTIVATMLSVLQSVLEINKENISIEQKIQSIEDKKVCLDCIPPGIWKPISKTREGFKQPFTALIDRDTGVAYALANTVGGQPYILQTVVVDEVTKTRGETEFTYAAYRTMHRRSDRIPMNETPRCNVKPAYYLNSREIKIPAKDLQDYCREIHEAFRSFGSAKHQSDTRGNKLVKGKTLDSSQDDIRNSGVGFVRSLKGAQQCVKKDCEPARDRPITSVVAAANLTTSGPRNKRNGGGNTGTATSQCLGISHKLVKQFRGDPPISTKVGKNGKAKARPTKNDVELKDSEIYENHYKQLTANASRMVPRNESGAVISTLTDLWKNATPETLEQVQKSIEEIGTYITYVFHTRLRPFRGLTWFAGTKSNIDLDVDNENRRLSPPCRILRDMNDINYTYGDLYCTDTVSWMHPKEHAVAILGGCFDQRISPSIFDVMLGFDPNDTTGRGTGPNRQFDYGNYNKQMRPGMIFGVVLFQQLPTLKYYPVRKGEDFAATLPSFSSVFVSPMGLTGSLPNPMAVCRKTRADNLLKKIQDVIGGDVTEVETIWNSVSCDDDKYSTKVVGSVSVPAISKDAYGILSATDLRVKDGEITLADGYKIKSVEFSDLLERLDLGIKDTEALKHLAADYPLGGIINTDFAPKKWSPIEHLVKNL